MMSDLFFPGVKPSPEEAERLKKDFEKKCQKAADALAEADVFLLVTGAGFSADSGLAVYGDVAKVPAYQARNLDYSDICMPDWLQDDPELFYGFWGQCYNDYRATQPHDGYDILARWRDDINANDAVAVDIQERITRKVQLRRPFDDEIVQRYTPTIVQGGPAKAFFSFTSNVDAHFYDKFNPEEIHECHGNIETWQCSDTYCSAGVWRAPFDFQFEVDTQTMKAPPSKSSTKPAMHDKTQQPEITATDGNEGNPVPHIGQTMGGKRRHPLKNMPPPKDPSKWHIEEHSGDNEGADEPLSNWPQCTVCHNLARPAILMFGDFSWKRDVAQGERWGLWKEAVLDLCEKRAESGHPLKVCILEIGCGMNVPTCRGASERMVKSVQKMGGCATLVRVNPDLPLSTNSSVDECLVPIMSRGLRAIKQIDEMYRAKSGDHTPSPT